MLLCLGVLGCGAATVSPPTPTSTSASTPTLSLAGQSKRDADKDGDNKTASRFDSDDNQFLYFGQAPGMDVEHEIAYALTRYYSAAAVGDGQTGCRFLDALTVEILVEEGSEASAGGKKGVPCATSLSGLFAKGHNYYTHQAAHMKIVKVRVEGSRGVAVLSFGNGVAPRRMRLDRERGKWKLADLTDLAMP
jgi:hypothetical protein